MAISVTVDPKSPRDMGRTYGVITLDGSYAAGGYAVTNSQFGMSDGPDFVTLNYVHATATNDFVPVWDKTNGKVKIFCSGTASATLNECTSGQITSSHSIQYQAMGRPIL